MGDASAIAGKESARSLRARRHRQARRRGLLRRREHRLFTLPEAQRITGKRGQFDQISVAARRGRDPGRARTRRLAEVLPRSVEVETGEENTRRRRRTSGEFIGFLKTAMLIFAGVSLFVAAFLIFNTFSITVAQRTREFAMLRTLGATRRQLVRRVVLEAFVIGLGASVLGLLAGHRIRPGDQRALQGARDRPAQRRAPWWRRARSSSRCSSGTALTVLASLIPALRITRVPPVTGLREGAVLETPKSHRRAQRDRRRHDRPRHPADAARACSACSPRARHGWASAPSAVFIGVALLSPRLVAPDGLGRGPPARALPRRRRPAGARERRAQPRPHRRDRRGADDRAGAGVVRGGVRRRPARLDQRRVRQDDRRATSSSPTTTASPTSPAKTVDAARDVDGRGGRPRRSLHAGQRGGETAAT